MISRLRKSLGFRLLGRDSVAALVTSRGETVREMRIRVNDAISATTGNVIRYGPLAGTTLPPSRGWNRLDRASMLLGLYERDLLERLAARFADGAPFVDIGGGDGYYCVGALKSGWCERAICFELSDKRREIIARSAEVNGVADRLTIFDGADEATFDRVAGVLGSDAASARYLIDIEGAEFSLLSDALLERLNGANIFIEIHKWADPDGSARATLRERAGRWFAIEEIETRARDLSPYPELAMLPDDERWLICSEGRKLSGLWWELTSLPGGASVAT